MKIRRLSLATGALVGALLTAPLLGLMYVANELAGLPFAPYDLFDWATRVLPGGLITFGIDMMIDTLLLFGISVADTAKTAEKVIAVLQFLFMGVGVGAIFFALMRLRDAQPNLQSGLVLGVIVGLPMITISIAIGGSDREPILSILWLLALFLAWGVALREGYARLNPDEWPRGAAHRTGEGRWGDRPPAVPDPAGRRHCNDHRRKHRSGQPAGGGRAARA